MRNRSRVTKFVLNRIGNDLNKLEDELTQKNVNNELKCDPPSIPTSYHYKPYNYSYDWSYQSNYHNQWDSGYTNYQLYEIDHSGQTNICTDNLIQIDRVNTYESTHSMPTSVYSSHSQTRRDISQRTAAKTQPPMAQNTHNVQNIDSRAGQKTKEGQPLFYHTSVQDDNQSNFFYLQRASTFGNNSK